MNRKILLIIVGLLVISASVYVGISRKDVSQANSSVRTDEAQKYDTTTSSSHTVVVNKRNPLNPSDYIPAGLEVPATPLRLGVASEEMRLVPDARAGLQQMAITASQEGIRLMLSSGYRSHKAQDTLYNFYVSKQGRAEADTQSARPGFSEHQTGLAADVAPVNGQCSVEVCFADLPEGKWVAAHAHEYGFIIRYPKGKDAITGYTYEPWHLRFVGTEAARSIYDSGKTMEEFFGLGPAPDYN